MSKSLQDKVAIITGGSRGLGAGTAKELARRGANLVITYNSAKDAADKVAAAIKQLGQEAIVLQAKGTDRSAPKRIVAAAVEKWGRVDIIINNAAASIDALLEDITEEQWDLQYETNVRFPTFLVQAALPYFGPTPRIVNISSTSARQGTAWLGAYAGSKAAMEGTTRVWATELGQKYNATVNCVNPGPIATDLWLRDTEQSVLDEFETKVKETPAAARIATVDDIAQIVGFLCEETSRWSTGSTVNANGGLVFV